MSSQPPKSLKSAIQVLVFQDGLSSRNFEIPISWITRLGWYLGGSLAVTILSVATAVHYWKQSHRAQPERLRELEQQIRLLGDVKQKADGVTPSPKSTLAAVAAPVACIAPTPSPQAAPVPMSSGGTVPIVWRSLPPSVQGEVPIVARPSVPLEVNSPSIRWQGRKLKLQFDIRFTGAEGKNQQGRIVVIARGPAALLSYPSGALSGTGSSALFDPDQGEFFSVSRFRQTKVEFPAVDSRIDTLEILLFGNDSIEGRQKLLLREILKVPSQRGGSRDAESEET